MRRRCDGLKRTEVWRKGTALLAVLLLTAGAVFLQPVRAAEFSSQKIETSYYREESIGITISGNEMKVTVPETEDYSYVIVTFMDSGGNAPQETQPVKVSGGTAVYRIEEQRNGVYYIQLYRGRQEDGTFSGVIGGMESIAVLSENGNVKIIPSPVYDSSVAAFEAKAVSADALLFYLQPSENVQSDDEKIRALADEITEAEDGAYEKILAVHDWVAENIYFDYDALYAQKGWPKDAVETLSARRGLCEGYANLTTALLRACGIPAKTVIGYALYGDDRSWTLSNMYGDRANHAWTEAFADGRWIMMDVTWDSDNAYRGGQYQSAGADRTYFDNTLEFFSYSHRQSREDRYDSTYIRIPFSDIEGHWAYESIRFAVNQRFMEGTGDGRFSPDENTTQGMFVVMLARMAGVLPDGQEQPPQSEPSSQDQMPPKTDSGEKWYQDAVDWAFRNAILSGPESGFAPDEPISRETMAVMLFRYIMNVEPEIAETAKREDAEIPVFSDQEEISPQALAAVQSTVRWGLLSGYDGGTFEPQKKMTRAEMAAVSERIQYQKICIQSVDNEIRSAYNEYNF